VRSPPIRQRYLHGELYSERDSDDERGLRFTLNTHVNIESYSSSISVDVQQLDSQLEPTAAFTVHNIDPRSLRELGLLFIEAANCVKFDLDEANSRGLGRMQDLYKAMNAAVTSDQES
jgi:hypothetical protein